MKTRFSNAAAFASRRTALALLGALAIGSMTLSMPKAWAQGGPLDGPRDQGIVGEGADGFAIPRDGAGGDVQALVDQINGERAGFYQSKADEQGVDVTAIQEIYAAAIYDNAPPGWWFFINGAWVQK